MSRTLTAFAFAFALLVPGALVVPGAYAQTDRQTASRTLQGQVTDASNKSLPDAVVYLKNNRDTSVKTYITDPKGNYRFNALSTTADYEVYAEFQGRRSEVRRLSSFDSRSQVTLHLRVK